MASYDGGYKCEFVETPPKIVQSECPVCLQIIREPYQANCCGYAFCQVCIEQVKVDNNPCPCCKAEKFDKFEDKRLKRTLYEFKVYCANKQPSCQWIGELSQLDNHLNSNPSQEKQLEGCQFTRVECLHCSELVQRSYVQIHQSKQCSKRPFSCEYCKDFNSTYEDVTTNHWSECGYYPMDCTNRCGKSIERQNLKHHIIKNCPLTVIDCEFNHVGCKTRLPRKDMAAHIAENVAKHVSLHAKSHKFVMGQLYQLREENIQLRQHIAKLTEDLKLQQICTPICPIEITMTNFAQHKKAGDEWISQPFYTHPRGYKMVMGVTANGTGVAEGTHVSVAIILMRGEFDERLEWPFQGHITILLYSQVDETCESRTVSFTGNEPGYNTAAYRVLTRDTEMAPNGLIDFYFLSHANLQPKYLKYDCLKLCVYQYMSIQH